jgi:hypothetical protein
MGCQFLKILLLGGEIKYIKTINSQHLITQIGTLQYFFQQNFGRKRELIMFIVNLFNFEFHCVPHRLSETFLKLVYLSKRCIY